MYHNRIAIFESLQSGKYMILIPTGPAFPINISVSSCICSYTLRTDPLASGQRKRSLPSDKKVETLPKRPKNDVTVQGMHDLYYRSPINFIILSSILTCIKTLLYITNVHSVYFLCPTMTTELLQLPNSIYHNYV